MIKELFLSVSFIFVGVLPASASDEMALAVSPRLFVDKPVIIKSIRCVSDEKSGFTCIKYLSGRLIVVGATYMANETKQSIAKHVIDQCTGSANLERSTCAFDIEATPINDGIISMMPTPSGSIPLTRIQVGGLKILRRAEK